MILKKTPLLCHRNFLSIETDGLSPGKNSILLISILQKETQLLTQYMIEDLKEEPILLENLYSLGKGSTFTTWEGQNFIHRFLKEKERHYGFYRNFILLNLSQKIRDQSYLFPFTTFNRSQMENYFHITGSSYSGREVVSAFRHYLKSRDREELDLIFEHNLKNMTSLVQLDKKFSDHQQEKMSLFFNEELFTIEKIHRQGQDLEVEGRAKNVSPYFSSDHRYTLTIDKNFTIRIPLNKAPYDERNCYFVLTKDFPRLSNQSSIPMPKAIIILYLDDFIFNNIIALCRWILQERQS
ncbi:MAG: ribonuclease H-like domain-containing protein [Tissierellia bacterium]|nr:ribonuclease H-like domain-containing protein [Tissierellia bacterium]